ncbi:unnamed protein product [Rotaria socialis]|uniref:Uncharacterized protein n=1 Tax=Rotaria socialis TaxID=392032 RepID=A0A817WHM2_9BILA|nr:unnamed protein product [Rotaria socialis]
MASNNENTVIDDNETMDDEKSSIPEEEGQENLELSGLAGPMNFLVCVYFIILSHINADTNQPINVNLDSVIDFLSTSNAEIGDEIDKLQELAIKCLFNLDLCIINQNEKKFYNIDATSIPNNQSWPRAYLVFDKNNRSFYPFYKRDSNKNNKIQTIFPVNDTHIFKLFQDSVDIYNWPCCQINTVQNMSCEDISMSDQESSTTFHMNAAKVYPGNQLETTLDVPSVCNLLVQNIKSLASYIDSQNSSSNILFKSSEYQLHDRDFVSPESAFKALRIQLERFSNIAHDTAESFYTSRRGSTSVESSDTTLVEQDDSSNLHKQDIFRNSPIHIKPSLPWSSTPTTFSNTTTNLTETIQLSKPVLVNQPTRFWHQRNLKELRDKRCPAVPVEGCGQRAGLLLKFGDDIKTLEEEVYLGVHAVTYDKEEHDQRFVVPMNTSVAKNINLKTNDLNEFIIVDNKNPYDEFDFTTKGAFLKINPKNLQKKCNFKMVNLYQGETINKDLIENKKLKWCRLMFAFYIKLSDGQFIPVSPATFSDLIEETNRAQSVETDSIFPNKFCERGGQMIFVQLNGVVKKCDLHVTCNGRKLEDSDFQIAEQILSFESPARTQGIEHLHVKISNKNTNLSIDYQQPYYLHDDHPDPCGVVN